MRGLDTVADFASKLKPGVLKIDKFVVTGASKVCDACACMLSVFMCNFILYMRVGNVIIR